MKNLFYFLLVALSITACTTSPKPKTIFIVRHAEKQLTGDDPELSVAGNARSVKLSQILADQNIRHIYSTDYQRTRLTAKRTADETGVPIESYDPKNHEELVEKLKSQEGNILVVGHSNTVSQLANYFVGDGNKFQDLKDSEYNFIYIVTIAEDGSFRVDRKTYKDY